MQVNIPTAWDLDYGHQGALRHYCLYTENVHRHFQVRKSNV